MADTNYFTNNDLTQRDIIENGNTTPMISTQLDSVRAYQWEVDFIGPDVDNIVNNNPAGITKVFTLGAKQVNGIGARVEDIEVNRVNDKVYFPGRPSMEECTITFDNLQGARLDKLLYEMFGKTYDPRTGTVGALGGAPPLLSTVGTTKFEIRVKQLDGQGQIINIVRLFGAYMKSIVHGEYNYSTNDFHTIECKFRYDNFVNTYDATGEVSTTPV
jgi:hypothetical protein|tara:strand:+ start:28963 stop:29610 length:648 start_codon:yes stop_codon:yes gene_type:complete